MGIGAVSSSEGEFNESGEDENSESSSSSQISSGAHEVDFADLFTEILLQIKQQIIDVCQVQKQLFGIKIIENYNAEDQYSRFSQLEICSIREALNQVTSMDIRSLEDEEFIELMDLWGFTPDQRQFIVQMLYSKIINNN